MYNNSSQCKNERKDLAEVYHEIQKILKDNGCYISSEMGPEDSEDFPYLVRREDFLIEKVKFEERGNHEYMFDSLKKCYNNCKNGNWNNLSRKEIEQLIKYQISARDANEENMTPEEMKKVTSIINEMISMAKKIDPGIQIDFD